MYYPYSEVKETKRVVSIGQLFFEIQPQMFKTYFWPSKLQNCMLNLICTSLMKKIVLALKLVYFREATWLFSSLQRGNFYPTFRKFLLPHKN